MKLNKQKIKILEINESETIMITNFDVVNICREIDEIQNTQNQFLWWFSNLSLENKVRCYFSFDKNYRKNIDMFLLKQLDLQEPYFIDTDLVPLLNRIEPSVFPISISLLVDGLIFERENDKEIEELKNDLINIINKKEHSISSSRFNIILLMLDKNCGSLITKFV